MAYTVNENAIAPEQLMPRVKRQRLLTRERTPGTKVLLDRIALDAGAQFELNVAAGSLAWFQILEGAVTLTRADGRDALTKAHIAFLPPGFRGQLDAGAGAVLLYAEVPEAARFDTGFASSPPQFKLVDWTREPVLDSQHDARKRIYVVTPKLFGTKAIKGEMIIYPPGTVGSNHHHEGAEHFMYVLAGSGTTYANEQPIKVTRGDLIYYDDRERHYLESSGKEDMVFIEFFVPGEYKTVWAENAPVCTWLPTGRSISGEKPVREIKAHSSAHNTAPQDV